MFYDIYIIQAVLFKLLSKKTSKFYIRLWQHIITHPYVMEDRETYEYGVKYLAGALNFARKVYVEKKQECSLWNPCKDDEQD